MQGQIVAISQWTIKARTYCTDFKVVMMKEMNSMFGGPGGGTHMLFLPSQAGLEEAAH